MELKCLYGLALIVTLFTSTVGSALHRREYGRNSERNESLVRLKRDEKSCSFNEYKCKNGFCVRANATCNGFYDCADGSDEAFALCRKNKCHKTQGRCNYGACYDKGSECSGRRDCVDNSDELLAKCTNKTLIVDGRFKCNSGQLIPKKRRCDGVADCKDGSDESVAACAGLLCSEDQFQCEYGGCVDGAAKCNGTVECRDRSDELLDICGKTTLVRTDQLGATTDAAVSVVKCVLPQQPENGVYHIVNETNIDDADYVLLQYTCYPGFKLIGKAKVLCWRGTWPALPYCVQTCPLAQHDSVEYHCSEDETPRVCDPEEPEGTVAVPKCKQHYYSPVELPYMRCSGGAWSSGPICTPGVPKDIEIDDINTDICAQGYPVHKVARFRHPKTRAAMNIVQVDSDLTLKECGTLTERLTPLVLGGEVAWFGDVPWHVGVYRRERPRDQYEQICGGSLISNTVVLSAAHCFWDERSKGLEDAEKFAIAAGKLYRSWFNEKDERFAQKSNVSKIVVPKLYRGFDLDYHHDIAAVIASKPFQYKLYVRPVCLDFRADFSAEQLKDGSYGKAAGWGLTSEYRGSESQELKMIDLPYVEGETCREQTSKSYLNYYVFDKICAGSLEGEALCRGDSGGGLSFASNISGVERFYLRGIASTTLLLKEHISCNVDSLTSFTSIIEFKEFIKIYLNV